jgi:hypothetical protein
MSSSSKFVKWRRRGTVILSVPAQQLLFLVIGPEVQYGSQNLTTTCIWDCIWEKGDPTNNFNCSCWAGSFSFGRRRNWNKRNSYDGNHTTQNIKSSNQNTQTSSTFKSLIIIINAPTTTIAQKETFSRAVHLGFVVDEFWYWGRFFSQ